MVSRLGLPPLPQPPLAAADLKISPRRLIDVVEARHTLDVDDGTYPRRPRCNDIDAVFPPRPPLLLPPATAEQRGGGPPPPPRPQALLMKENEEEECAFLFHSRMADPHNDAILLLFIIPHLRDVFLGLGIDTSIYVESTI